MAATLSPLAPPDGAAEGRTMRFVHAWDVTGPESIGDVRREMTRILTAASPRSGGPDASPQDLGGLVELRNRVALSCSELVTNALRHGRLPIAVRLLTDDSSWMLDVSDAAPDRLPDPYPERPLGHGGYGLMLVARLASEVGWYVRDDSKHVWARIGIVPDHDLVEDLSTD